MFPNTDDVIQSYNDKLLDSMNKGSALLLRLNSLLIDLDSK